MRYETIITHVDFKAMVNGMSSVLQLSVDIPARHLKGQLLTEEINSTELICTKYKFRLTSPDTYDFEGIVGKKCVVEGNGVYYTFVAFMNG